MQTVVEQETRVFWIVASSIRRSHRAGTEPTDEIVDEADLLYLMAETPKITVRTGLLLRECEGQSKVVMAIGGANR